MDEPYKTLAYIITGLIVFLAGYYGSYRFVFKKKLSQFRECVDAVDNAWKDDNVSIDEFDGIWAKCYSFFKDIGG